MSAVFNLITSSSANTNTRLLQQTLTGTVTTVQNSFVITGSGTAFLNEANTGDRITISGVEYIVSSVDSNTQITLTTAYVAVGAGGLSVTTLPEINFQNGTSFIFYIKADNSNTDNIRFGRSLNPSADGTDISNTARSWTLAPGEVSPAILGRDLRSYYNRSQTTGSQRFSVLITRT
jgi:hypothetical protein